LPFSSLYRDSPPLEVACFDGKLQAGKGTSGVQEFKGLPEITACEEEEKEEGSTEEGRRAMAFSRHTSAGPFTAAGKRM